MESSLENCTILSRQFAVPLFSIKDRIEKLTRVNKMEASSKNCATSSRQFASPIKIFERNETVKMELSIEKFTNNQQAKKVPPPVPPKKYKNHEQSSNQMMQNGEASFVKTSPPIPLKRFRIISLVKFELEGRIEKLEFLHFIESSSQHCVLSASQCEIFKNSISNKLCNK